MISNNLSLSSQKFNSISRQKSLRRFATQPAKNTKQCIMQARLRQSQDNLFNFIRDSII